MSSTSMKDQKYSPREGWAFAAAMFLLVSVAGPCRASLVFNDLGSAGPGNFAILVGPGTTDFALNGPGTTFGNVGYDGHATVQLNASNNAPMSNVAIAGNLFLATGATVNNSSQVGGTIATVSSALDNDWSAALMASADFSAMAATQSVPGGAINGTSTISSTGGTNVIVLNSVNLGNGQTLTLHGSATDQFIINVSGNFVLNSGKILLTGGLTPDDVVFNITSSGNAVSTSGGLGNESIINGIVLAPNSGIAMAPGLIIGELIAGGATVHLVSGASVDTSPAAAVPEPSTDALIGAGLLVVGCFARKRHSGVKTPEREYAD
jgi:hypothetical protein